ncbi:nucleotide pyrophosphohydrolase [Mycoplasmatota bacterium WC44]
MDLKELQKLTVEFRDKRNWRQFHTGSNLAKSISIEAAEILELFQWNDDVEVAKLSEELSDVLSYLMLLADVYDIDLEKAYLEKIKKNNDKYPVNKSYGVSTKYNKL